MTLIAQDGTRLAVVYVLELLYDGVAEADSILFDHDEAIIKRDELNAERIENRRPGRYRVATLRSLDAHPHTKALQSLVGQAEVSRIRAMERTKSHDEQGKVRGSSETDRARGEAQAWSLIGEWANAKLAEVPGS